MEFQNLVSEVTKESYWIKVGHIVSMDCHNKEKNLITFRDFI